MAHKTREVYWSRVLPLVLSDARQCWQETEQHMPEETFLQWLRVLPIIPQSSSNSYDSFKTVTASWACGRSGTPMMQLWATCTSLAATGPPSTSVTPHPRGALSAALSSPQPSRDSHHVPSLTCLTPGYSSFPGPANIPHPVGWWNLFPPRTTWLPLPEETGREKERKCFVPFLASFGGGRADEGGALMFINNFSPWLW